MAWLTANDAGSALSTPSHAHLAMSLAQLISCRAQMISGGLQNTSARSSKVFRWLFVHLF